MNNTVSITLEVADVLQTIDALNDRAEAWQKTEASLLGSNDSDEDFFIPEECDDPIEAAEIAEHFREIISTIEKQLDERQSIDPKP